MSDKHLQLASILMDIEKELRDLELWQRHTPASDKLDSMQPFAIDTLTFPQWLQFIFIPRAYELIEARAPLPRNCGIAPMAEEYFRSLEINSDTLIIHLRVVDQVLAG
ncbi:YqcC family protein [Marinimicrobium alkaliphilum]|uniref:YqcC family protein n=1 Tax=Marinimicrobium alkaliphilum TaxID=2202654 RepID=UPI000DBA6551|nr:YqcC family protein [Marinimicrobium alkaliphilum]